MSKKGKIVFIVVITIAAIAAGLTVTYLFGRDYFKTHFLWHTTVNGRDVSKVEMEKIRAEIKDAYPTAFTIHEKDGLDETIDFSDLILNNDVDVFIEQQEEAALTWYYALFGEERSFTSSDIVTIEKDGFEERVEESLNQVKRVPSTDAYLDIEEMQIIPETIGNEINVKEACEKAYAAAKDNDFEVTLDKEYILPKVYQDDTSLTSVLDEYDKRINRKIKVTVADGIKETIGQKRLANWIHYDGKEFKVDEEKVYKYTVKLEEKYNTAWSERPFETSYGSTIYVGRGPFDSYVGWLMNEDETYQSILSAVESDEGKKAKVTWDYEGYTLDENANDIGGTYIEISVDDQHMWFYKNNKLMLDTDVVTGTETNPNRRTPRGLFYLLEMHSPYVMHGDYGQQPCEYFIKVTWDGVAIHDADWQSAFGGTIYQYAGSHGCINTPHQVVAKLWDYLYEMEEWQIPVIIY